MSGIYLHVPFCTSKCNYCNFFSVTTLSRKSLWLKALTQEIALRKDFFDRIPSRSAASIETIYFGGGTPSLLEVNELSILMETLRHTFSITREAEITLEANPDDLTMEKLVGWRKLGINRLSLGVQSLQEDMLRYLNRRHAADKALEIIALAQEAGFTNLTADLIYGIPGLSDSQWESDINKLVNNGIKHLSAYSLTVEQKTALDYQIRNGIRPRPDDEEAARHFDILRQVMAAKGFDHYEISNFALQGFRSRHNSAYWSGQPYLGLGPSAHSFDGYSRYWTPPMLNSWLEGCNSGKLIFESETLTKTQRYNELLITRLRSSDGLAPSDIEKLDDEILSKHFVTQIQRHISQGNIIVKENSYQVAHHRLFTSDAIIVELMYSD